MSSESESSPCIDGTDVNFDLSSLLKRVQAMESEFLASQAQKSDIGSFGHHETPRMELFSHEKCPNAVMIIAFSLHCAAVGVFGSQSVNIFDLCSLGFEDGESITCLTSVSLDVPKGALSPSELESVVVIGTSGSRVYSIDLLIDTQQLTVRRPSDDPRLFEVLPLDQSTQSSRHVLFSPQGGVTGLSCHLLLVPGSISPTTHIWITYGDGTIIRLHHAGLFPSVWKQGAEAGKSLDAILGIPVLLRCQVCLPKDEVGISILPLPHFHPSLLSPISSLSLNESLFDPPMEALVYATPESSEMFPTLAFYSSESHFIDREDLLSRESGAGDNPIFRSVVGGTKALVGGMMGTALGAFRWGLMGSKNHVVETAPVESDGDDSSLEDVASAPFPSLWTKAVTLFSVSEFHDPPRRYTNCLVDPRGDFAATIDTLGRVTVFDLRTKQVLWLWKGYRDAYCKWVHLPEKTSQQLQLHLAIHSRRRQVLEIWHVRKKKRVFSRQIDNDTTVVSCSHLHNSSFTVQAYLSSASPLSFVVSSVGVHDIVTLQDDLQENRKKDDSLSVSRLSTQRLQRLQQLLSTDSVEFTLEDVEVALKEVPAGDLSAALKLVAESEVVEQRLGPSFHNTALDHCKCVLEKALNSNGEHTMSNPQVQELSKSLQYHSQIRKVYEVLTKFDLRIEHRGSQYSQSQTQWAQEAMGWVDAYEHVTDRPLEDETSVNPMKKVRLATVFTSCVAPSHAVSPSQPSGLRIYFSDSSRTRKEVLVHVFKALLGDIFSLNVVVNAFDALGIRDDTDYILKCFGEWFMLLPRDAITVCLYSSNPPMTRFLRDMSSRELRSYDEKSNLTLQTLHELCSESTDLLRGFLLAVLCREAIARAALQREKTSFGNIASDSLVAPWNSLLRKLRVCLLVSLRLGNTHFPAPITVKQVEECDVFSVYEWLARDELALTHDQEELTLLEQSCQISCYSFDPSQPEGDDAEKVKILQNACLASHLSEDVRTEYLVDFDDNEERFGSLLLFFGRYNDPPMLAAHRSLLLAKLWLADPVQISLLRASYVALDTLHADNSDSNLTAAVCLDVWKICAVVFRAHLFGWDDIQKISEPMFRPLMEAQDWFLSFGKLCLRFLRILRVVEFDLCVPVESEDSEEDSGSWPRKTPDFITSRLRQHLHKFNETAVDTHCVIVCGIIVSDDIEMLVQCVPTIYDCFLPTSLSQDMPASSNVVSTQMTFLQNAISSKAISCPLKTLDRFLILQEIETLAHIWGVQDRLVRSEFLRAMYELERDDAVEDLIVNHASQIDVKSFVVHGIDIACHRLHAWISGDRLKGSARRNIIGLLDADTCSFIQERNDSGSWLVPMGRSEAKIQSTHNLIVRMLSMCAGSNVDPETRLRVHALGLVSGILVREISRYQMMEAERRTK